MSINKVTISLGVAKSRLTSEKLQLLSNAKLNTRVIIYFIGFFCQFNSDYYITFKCKLFRAVDKFPLILLKPARISGAGIDMKYKNKRYISLIR